MAECVCQLIKEEGGGWGHPWMLNDKWGRHHTIKSYSDSGSKKLPKIILPDPYIFS